MGIPAATGREHRDDRWTPRCRRCWLLKDETLNIWWMLARWTTYPGDLVVDTEGSVVEQRRMFTTAWYAVRKNLLG